MVKKNERDNAGSSISACGNESSGIVYALLSEPFDKYIDELREDLHNELKDISKIVW